MTITNQKNALQADWAREKFPAEVCVVTGQGMASREATQGLEARYILGMRLGGNKEVQKSPFPAWEVPGRGRKPLGEGGSPLQWQVGAEDEHRAFPQPRRPFETRPIFRVFAATIRGYIFVSLLALFLLHELKER